MEATRQHFATSERHHEKGTDHAETGQAGQG